MSFNYTNIVGKECAGWINLFFGDEVVALVNNVDLANRIREEIPERALRAKPNPNGTGGGSEVETIL